MSVLLQPLPKNPSKSSFQLLITCAPGIENVLAAELSAYQQASPTFLTGKRITGGIEARGSLYDIYALNLHLRTASRVLLRLGEFNADTFEELQRRALPLPWELYLKPGEPLVMRVSSGQSSHLYHSDAVAERLLETIGKRIGRLPMLTDLPETTSEIPPQLLVVRIFRNRCTLNIDSSGANLHRRGYRLAVAKAPLRENLAAALLLDSGWQPGQPLIDPFCGSGTIPIEAAMLAQHRPPGLKRRFRFAQWRDYDAGYWKALLAQANAGIVANHSAVLGSDRDAGAVSAAQANAERAGVGGGIVFQHCAISDIHPPENAGWVFANPPYGIRVRQKDSLRNLYAAMGNVLRERFAGWHAGLLCSDARLIQELRQDLQPQLRFSNGGVRVKLYIGNIT